MKRFFSIQLPYPPSLNRRRSTAYGRSFVAKEAKEYKLKIVSAVKLKYPGFETFTNPVKVNVIFFAPDNKVRDIDNLYKDLLDALTKAKVYKDDSLIIEKHSFKIFDKNIKDCLIIEISEI